MKRLKKNIDKSRNFTFQNLIFSHFVRLNIAIKRIPHIFPWLCDWDVCYMIFCHLLHIHSAKNRGFVFITIVQFMMSSNIIRLFVHNTISLSSLCKLIWRHWTCVNLNACQIDFVESVSEIKHILSVIYYTIYGAVCFQFANLPYDDWDDIYFVLLSSSNRKYELLPIV